MGHGHNEKATNNETSTFHDKKPTELIGVRVVARISTHVLREERAYHICKTLTGSADPEGNHIIRPIDIVRLTDEHGDNGLIVCIFEDAGPNYLEKVVDFGPAWYHGSTSGEKIEGSHKKLFIPSEAVSLRTFLDFAIGATECLEILHHGQQGVHGEIRGDAFTMNIMTGKVKLAFTGSGLRSFENGLTSTGWSMLSKEVGARTKLCECLHDFLKR